MNADAMEARLAGPSLAAAVPSANPSVEPELQRLLPESVRFYATRLPAMPGTTLVERNRQYVSTYPDAVRSFGNLPLAGLVIALTGASYRLGLEEDRALCGRLRETGGMPVATASLALAEALDALGAKRIALFSPYPAWLTEESLNYWRSAGFEVAQVVKASESNFRAYELTSADVLSALTEVRRGEVDATVMSGTGMLTLPAILASEGLDSFPLLSSNLACAWWLMRAAGIAEPGAAFRAAAPRLAASL